MKFKHLTFISTNYRTTEKLKFKSYNDIGCNERMKFPFYHCKTTYWKAERKPGNGLDFEGCLILCKLARWRGFPFFEIASMAQTFFEFFIVGSRVKGTHVYVLLYKDMKTCTLGLTQ